MVRAGSSYVNSLPDSSREGFAAQSFDPPFDPKLLPKVGYSVEVHDGVPTAHSPIVDEPQVTKAVQTG